MKLKPLLLLIFLAALVWYLNMGDVEVATKTEVAPIDFSDWILYAAIFIVTMILIIVAVWQRAKILPQTKAHPKIALFVCWTIFLYVAAVTLHHELRDWLLTPTGFGLLALLIAMVVILCLGVEILKDSWFTIIIFVLLTVAIVDPGIMRQIPQGFKDKLVGFSGGNTKYPVTYSPKTVNSPRTYRETGCKGVYEKHTLSSSPSLMEDGADCWFSLDVKYGTVRLLTEDNKYIDVEAGSDMKLDRRIKFKKWRALGTEAIVDAAFCDRGTNWNGSSCS